MGEAATKPIWFSVPPTEMGAIGAPGLFEHLGMALTGAGPDWLEGTMPVDARTLQPFGLLHGGASVVLAESLASIGSAAVVDLARHACVGLEINANHLRPVRDGTVTGIGRPPPGRPHPPARATHVGDIRLADAAGRPVCVSRCTVAIIDRPPDEAKRDPI